MQQQLGAAEDHHGKLANPSNRGPLNNLEESGILADHREEDPAGNASTAPIQNDGDHGGGQSAEKQKNQRKRDQKFDLKKLDKENANIAQQQQQDAN